jgi:hypothetical protein
MRIKEKIKMETTYGKPNTIEMGMGHMCPALAKKDFPEIIGGDFNGESIEEVSLTPNGQWVATQWHHEYGTVINYCPFCGIKLYTES